MFITPNHVRLVSSCYPASALAAGPDFKPNPQELSRLTYYGTNRPGKLTKLGAELEKRAQAHSRRAATGNLKSRAILLITLAILKALCAECRNDISLFSRSVLNSVDFALTALPADLELISRAASVFTAFTTYTDGRAIGVDEPLSKSYSVCLLKFASTATWRGKNTDSEFKNRMRLVGLAALSGAISSDALHSSIESTKAQVAIIVPALLQNTQEAGLGLLKEQEASIEISKSSSSPYLYEFQPQRPLHQRRAASIHIHIDGETGPTFADVIYAVLWAAKTLLGRSDGPQVGSFIHALFANLDATNKWSDTEFCCWMALRVTDWTQYQHRYAVPVQLIARLVNVEDVNARESGRGPSFGNVLPNTLVAMIATVFSARTPIANLSTSDVLTNLLGVLLSRVTNNAQDSLLASLVACISALGTHLYYADQIHDLAEELIRRLISLQLDAKIESDFTRQEGLRCLIACLSGLIRIATSRNETHEPSAVADPADDHSDVQNERESLPKRAGTVHSGIGRRHNPIAPDVWQDTLALLCEANYGVRADYTRALTVFIKSEIPRERRRDHVQRLPRPTPLVLDTSMPDETTRFLHALHASAYALATSPSLGISPSSTVATDSENPSKSTRLVYSEPPTATTASTTDTVRVNVINSTPVGTPVVESFPVEVEPARKASHGEAKRGSSRSRTSSLPLSLLEPISTSFVAPSTCSANISDYSHLVTILSAAYDRTPFKALMCGVPMLFALDEATCTAIPKGDKQMLVRRRALREALARIWDAIGSTLDSQEIKDLAATALSTLPAPSLLSISESTYVRFPQAPEEPIVCENLKELPSEDWCSELPRLVDPQLATAALSSNAVLKQTAGVESQVISRRLSVQWSVGFALGCATRDASALETGFRIDGGMPFLKLSPGLMHIDNKSLQSLARSARHVGVGDLKEALEGRATPNRSVTALGYPPSMSSLGHQSTTEASEQGFRQRVTGGIRASNGEVKDILNKLGIGKGSASRAKAVFKSPLQPKRRSTETSQNAPTL
ncbi:uncharacterized protein EI90DRAFT_3150476 [Cantharellus anzutake]|uniref:uncharacterized protein n=1 Tax=Cantharellus anzutake TaxID=1750568 RepID=UPI0019080908|nr:uncharacterized protein EI90DRAFT_3150476 [Cantharellus anzutake]KAF8341321.1 hypothetical protein EI90DRAFT_3150476 [Cantharellus anzutake]